LVILRILEHDSIGIFGLIDTFRRICPIWIHPVGAYFNTQGLVGDIFLGTEPVGWELKTESERAVHV
jgi:hypothetical protein